MPLARGIAAAVLLVSACSSTAQEANEEIAVQQSEIDDPAPSTTEFDGDTAPDSSLAPTTTEGSTPESDSVPTAGWQGVVVSRFEGEMPVVEFLAFGEELVADAVVEAPAAGICSTDLVVTDEGVFVGSDPSGESSDAWALAWGAREFDASVVVTSWSWPWQREIDGFEVVRPDPEGNLRLRVEQIDSEIEVVGTSGDFGAAVEAHEGHVLLLRVEPFEPACDRGAVFVLDLVAGRTLGCVPFGAADLSPSPDERRAERLPDSPLDFGACRS